MTIEELKYLKESEDRVEFKAATRNFNGGSHADLMDRRKCVLGYVADRTALPSEVSYIMEGQNEHFLHAWSVNGLRIREADFYHGAIVDDISRMEVKWSCVTYPECLRTYFSRCSIHHPDIQYHTCVIKSGLVAHKRYARPIEHLQKQPHGLVNDQACSDQAISTQNADNCADIQGYMHLCNLYSLVSYQAAGVTKPVFRPHDEQDDMRTMA